METKLSRPQQSALNRLREEYEVNPTAKHSAYDLRTSLTTLRALHNRGLIEKFGGGHGATFFPRSCVLFRYIKPKPPLGPRA